MSEEKRIEYIVSTLSAENLTPSNEALMLCRKIGSGYISVEDALHRVLAYHGVQAGRENV